MSRSRQWPPTIQNHRGRARIRIDGREYYLGTYGSAEAAQEYARLIALAGQPDDPPPAAGVTVAELVERFMLHAQANYAAEGGQVVRFHQALRVVVAEFAATPAADFRVLQLEAVRKRMIKDAWCRNHINRQVVRIRTCWRWAELQGLVPEGRWQHLRSLKCLGPKQHGVKHTLPRQPATREELDAVKSQAQPAIASMLEVQYQSGMRSCEVRIMRPGDIDRTGEVWLYTPAHHKTEHLGHTRVIALGPECQRVLLPWLIALPAQAAYLFRGLVARRTKDGSGVIGEAPYTTCGYAQAVRRAAERAGVPGFHPYRLRHSARLRITRTHGLDAARAVLGQRHVETALNYAAGQDVETAARVAKEAG